MRFSRIISIILILSGTTLFLNAQEAADKPTGAPVEDIAPEATPVPAMENTSSSSGQLNVYTKVNGMDNWDYTYDVSGLERGMYNIIIKGTDKAGNIFYSNPANVLIDPESDLPIASITNPVPDMRVGGAILNIVGTCNDDDAVGRVEVRIDEGEFKPAEGKDFWSYKLSTEGMPDGRHMIGVRGIDVNGVTGEIITRSFHLDTSKPFGQVTNQPSGVLLSGGNELQGTVEDLNGVTALFSSEDHGKTFQKLDFWFNQEDNKYHFKLWVETTRMEDGSQVILLKSLDGMGSVGLASFLFFVDNKKPVIEILSPAQEEKVNGNFYVAGKVLDEVGIKSLTYSHRDKTEEIPLIPGNLYWFVEIDATGKGSNTETVKFTVTDKAGNVVEQNTNINIDLEADKPVVVIAYPKADSPVSAAFDVYGFVDDDDEPESVVWTLDSKAPVTIPAIDGFTFPLDQLDPGKHTLAVYGIDVNGVKGNPAKVEFTVQGSQSSINIETVAAKGESVNFKPGAEVNRFDKAVLRGKITEFQPFKKVRYTLGNGEEKDLSLQGTEQKFIKQFTIPVPENQPYGINDIKITAIDSLERTTEYYSFIHVTNFSKAAAKSGIYIADSRTDEGQAAISREYPLYAFFLGDKVKSVVLEPDIPQAGVSESDGSITIVPNSDFSAATTKIKVTTVNDEVVYSGSITLKTDSAYSADPLHSAALTQALPKSGSRAFYPGLAFASQDGQTKLEGSCNSAVARLEYSFNNKDYRGADYKRKKEDPSSVFQLALPNNLGYGYNEIYVRLYDEQKGTAQYKTFFFKTDAGGSAPNDADGLYFSDVRTAAGDEINLTREKPFTGYFNGREIKSVALKPESAFLKAVFEGRSVTVQALEEGKSGPTTIEVTAANNKTYTSKAYVFQANAIPPIITTTSMEPGTWVNKSFTIEGTVNESTGIKTMEYSVGGNGDWKKISLSQDKGAIPFSQVINTEGIEDGKIAVYLHAVDTGGNETFKVIAVKKDSTKPEITLITPEETARVNGIFSVIGKVTEAGKLKSLEFSSDNKNYEPLTGRPVFTYNLDLSKFEKLPEKYYIKAVDTSGNETVMNPVFPIDFEADKPRVEIQIPAKDEVLRNNFLISGVVFDDDGVKAIYYRLDDGEFEKVEGENSFSIPIKIGDIADNEHTVEIQAEDIGGIRGDIASSTFWISKAEPVSVLQTPAIETTTKGTIPLSGTAMDANGIKAVYLSFDNGNTYHLTKGTDEWNYRFNTSLLADGVHRLLIKAVDNTGTEGLSATLVNVDNTQPILSLDRPSEGETVSGSLILDGRAFDNINLTSLSVNLAPVNQSGINAAGTDYELSLNGVFVKKLALGGLNEGWYNIRVAAKDKANNTTYVSRNVQVIQKKVTNRVEQIFPLDGESACGNFLLSGHVISEAAVKGITYAIDDKDLGSLEFDDNAYFSTDLGPAQLPDGEHIIVIKAELADGTTVVSEKKRFLYTAEGPWVRINSLKTGDFITKRPWMKGDAGYYLAAPDQEDREAYTAYEQAMNDNRIEKIEVSLDNGKSFINTGGTTNWNYRLQTQNIPDGDVRILVRATTASGKTAITRAMVNNDDMQPYVRILLPEENKRFNDKISILGIASDENGLKDVEISLRRGDKAGYKIPEFIQGMYFDAQFRTNFIDPYVAWNVGLGLTFFDQNVKLQVQAGYVPSVRFGGMFIGAKLLANIFLLPMEVIFGPDLDFMSVSLALGANFSYCTNSQYDVVFSEKGLILAAVIGQIEFAKFTIKDQVAFNTYSLYGEIEVWFLSSDVVGAPAFEPRINFGARIGLF
ncbi:MAG: hypothetical protein JW969_04200 [Spirochaetales bacterium]|nr:hypothetical protein [Spirochaetales bacterium]